MARQKPAKMAINFYGNAPPTRDRFSDSVVVTCPEDDVAREMVHILCTYGGSMTVDAIVEAIGLGKKKYYFGGSKPELLFGKYPDLFELDIKPYRTQVTVKTKVRACDDYVTREGCRDLACPGLHICKRYAVGTCKFGGTAGGRVRKCFYSHDFHDDHNTDILSSHLLEHMSDTDIHNILQESWKSLSVPAICKFYNKGEAGCGKGSKCPFLHVCEHYVTGDCAFTNSKKRECKRSHNILDPQPRALLIKFKVDVQRSPKAILQDVREGFWSWKGGRDDPRSPTAVTPAESFTRNDRILEGDTDICPYYVRGKCNYRGACVRHHCDMPYLWQRKGRGSDAWISYDANLSVKIEKAFCDASRDDVTVFDPNQVEWNISFDEMKATNLNTYDTAYKVRRLSTWSSSSRESSSSVDSKNIELAYSQYMTDDGKDYIRFTAGRQNYTLNFEGMKQENDKYTTQRNVRRRPKFMSDKDVEETRRMPGTTRGVASLSLRRSSSTEECVTPDHWDTISADDYGDYQFVELTRGMDEYDDLVEKLRKTIPRSHVVRVVRVQNVELWDLFSRKKKWMTKKNKDVSPEEKQLFHGTKNEFVDAICQQNFDFRLSGTRVGKKFGMGSYFARDASYSHRYTENDNDGIRQMFVARVLVGSYAQGQETFRKPPPKDVSRPLGEIYDSCVNNAGDPSIFVIFDNSQTYPEYVISYQ
ncbi:protein mono-ADP-ribosyltransferase PARP12-like [Glandiceps talaboti]